MKRRGLVLALGGALTSARGPRAEQTAMPMIGFLGLGAANAWSDLPAAFRQGLAEAGFVEGQNVAIEYRWVENDGDRLPALAANLVGQQVAVIVATDGSLATRAAMLATRTIPIVFTSGADPVAESFVASLGRPGGNVTGVTLFTGELQKKRVQLLLELVPKAATIAFLVNPNNPNSDDPNTRDAQSAARSLGLQVQVASARTERDLDEVFRILVRQRVDALIVVADPFIEARRHQLVALAALHAIPAIFQWREDVVAGGLISYGASIANMYRLAGVYTGKFLKGAKPADLPVMQPTNFELVINLKTANALGITVPQSILGRTDEVIE
jgi:putative ABC transport system substrate-binding protein